MSFEVLEIAEPTKEGGLADPLLRASSEHSIHLARNQLILSARCASTGD